MRKLDKLILRSFIGPFILTFLVVVFILLMVQMLKYFDDIIGKDLGALVISQLLFYFAVFTTPTALPLAVLLSSLITFGNLGEHFELTAIKSAGISLLRTLQPIFFVVIILTVFAFYINNNLVPKAALEAYSLLYDIKQKKPALDLREGTFYNGIPDISIKVDKKFPKDQAALKGVVVYDHRNSEGNKDVIKADSGRMYTILNERYLKFELYNGYNYREGAGEEQKMTGTKPKTSETLTRSKFDKTQIVFDLSSFGLTRTDPKWFQGNRIMRNLSQLEYDMDSVRRDILQHKLNYYLYKPSFFSFLKKSDTVIMPADVKKYKLWKDSVEASKYTSAKQDSINTAQNVQVPVVENPLVIPKDHMVTDKPTEHIKGFKKRRASRFRFKPRMERKFLKDSLLATMKDTMAVETYFSKVDSVFNRPPTREIIQSAANMARQVKAQVVSVNTNVQATEREYRVFMIQWHRILSSSLACIAMFLIGAPLGAIIKKGGLGVPFLVSILFFIIYYLLTMQGEKLAKQDAISVISGVWAADVILFIIGFVFLRQARIDARIFDADAYRVALEKLRLWLKKRQYFTPRVAS
jgi:lipopolysaccharide export system permease protein